MAQQRNKAHHFLWAWMALHLCLPFGFGLVQALPGLAFHRFDMPSMCALLTQAAQLLQVPCDYGMAAVWAGAFVACAVAVAALCGRAGQQPVGEEEVY